MKITLHYACCKKIVTPRSDIIISNNIIYDFKYYLYFCINNCYNALKSNKNAIECCICLKNPLAIANDNLQLFYKLRTITIFKKIIKENYLDFLIQIVSFLTSMTQSKESPFFKSSKSLAKTGIVVVRDPEIY